jgi:hypothetical protein
LPETVNENADPAINVEGKTLNNAGGSVTTAKRLFVFIRFPEISNETVPKEASDFKVELSGARHFTELADT